MGFYSQTLGVFQFEYADAQQIVKLEQTTNEKENTSSIVIVNEFHMNNTNGYCRSNNGSDRTFTQGFSVDGKALASLYHENYGSFNAHQVVRYESPSFTGIKHNEDGTKQIQVSYMPKGNQKNGFYIGYTGRDGYGGYFYHPKAITNKIVTLQPIPVGSKLTFNSTAYLEEPLIINIQRPVTNYKQDIELRVPYGNNAIKLIPIVANNTQTQISWIVPKSLGTYFPNDKTLAANIACYDKDLTGKVVYSKQYPVTLALNEKLAIPDVQVIVKDINAATVALTGDEKVLIINQSRAQYEITATPKYNATIKSYQVFNGDTVLSTATGIIDKPYSGDFLIVVNDSRGYKTTRKIISPVIEYRDPSISLSNNKPDVNGNYIVDTSGMWFSGNFGAVSNTLTIQYRVREKTSSIEGEWITIPQSKKMTRLLLKWQSIYTVTGLDYRKTYVFQTRAFDKLTTVYSSEKTVKALPVFDWGENQINFNVPIEMKETQVLDIDEVSKDVTLSGGGELIHIRPRSKGSTLKELTVGGDQLLYNGKPVEGGTKTPIATTSTPGIVKPDGTTIKVTADGTISAAGGGEKVKHYVNPTSVPLVNGGRYFFSAGGQDVTLTITMGNTTWNPYIAAWKMMAFPCFQKSTTTWSLWNEENGWMKNFVNVTNPVMYLNRQNKPLDVYIV